MAHGNARPQAVGAAAGAATAGLTIVYLVALAWGLAERAGPNAAIADPWLAVMEGLILFIAPAIVVLIWSIQASATPPRAIGRASLAFMAAGSAITWGVHACLLAQPRDEAAMAFVWPTAPYVLDVLSWDVFFPISVLLAAPLIRGGRMAAFVRALFVVSAVLALAGLAGVPTGDMRLRDIGIVGYAVVFPAAAACLATMSGTGPCNVNSRSRPRAACGLPPR